MSNNAELIQPIDETTPENWPSRALHLDGWNPQTFPIDGSPDDAFGWVRGPFGIFCVHAESNIGVIEVAALTHLKSGMRLFFFDSIGSAAEAGRLAERIGDWDTIGKEGISGKPEWQENAKRMYRIWQNAGLQYTPITILGRGVWAFNHAKKSATH